MRSILLRPRRLGLRVRALSSARVLLEDAEVLHSEGRFHQARDRASQLLSEVSASSKELTPHHLAASRLVVKTHVAEQDLDGAQAAQWELVRLSEAAFECKMGTSGSDGEVQNFLVCIDSWGQLLSFMSSMGLDGGRENPIQAVTASFERLHGALSPGGAAPLVHDLPLFGAFMQSLARHHLDAGDAQRAIQLADAYLLFDHAAAGAGEDEGGSSEKFTLQQLRHATGLNLHGIAHFAGGRLGSSQRAWCDALAQGSPAFLDPLALRPAAEAAQPSQCARELAARFPSGFQLGVPEGQEDAQSPEFLRAHANAIFLRTLCNVLDNLAGSLRAREQQQQQQPEQQPEQEKAELKQGPEVLLEGCVPADLLRLGVELHARHARSGASVEEVQAQVSYISEALLQGAAASSDPGSAPSSSPSTTTAASKSHAARARELLGQLTEGEGGSGRFLVSEGIGGGQEGPLAGQAAAAALGVATELKKLGQVLYNLQLGEESVGVLRRCVALHESSLGGDHLLTAMSLNDLGMAQLRKTQGTQEDLQRGREEARSNITRALAIKRAHYAEDDPEIATGVANAGLAEMALRNLEGAEKLLSQASAIWGARLSACQLLEEGGAAHPGEREAVGLRLATVSGHLGELNFLKGDYASAETHIRSALVGKRDALGEGHQQVQVELNNLASVMVNMSRYEEACDLYRELIAAISRTQAADSIAVAVARCWLANALTGRQDLEEAAATYESVMPTLLGGMPPGQVAFFLGRQLAVLEALGREEEATAVRSQLEQVLPAPTSPGRAD